ncbi:venom carboxylesterase-6-like [Macrosteles quadrilineatus]|uniref:venom carboxylesterase-6-like n=1 Tax=Macrosteles quadrilineatus TaxID=74068 RepID=UPI0023E20192|nr:venom carboxylesterase-6-like [Macrosteles quadrilineatus]
MFLTNSVLTLFVLDIAFVSGQTVSTELGNIRGEEITIRGTLLYVFSGIPYAKQPVGDLRFKDPVPLTKSYSGNLFEATQNKKTRCVQFLKSANKVIGQEDCLTLNIYTTTLDSSAGYDVLVFIHGGAFQYGSGHPQTPEYIYNHEKKLVFVSINYRLGPFGFLSTGDEVVPGNMGLKDQVVALEWINRNIKSFGGNRNNIVLAGMSAGGVGVHLHYMAPLSRHLFSKGISMSGVALSKLTKTWKASEGFENLASLFPDCEKEKSTQKIVDCLTKIPAYELNGKLVSQNRPWGDFNTYEYFGPVVEKGSPKPFLDENPFHLLRKGKIKSAPWLVSATTAEGLFHADDFIDHDSKMQELDQNWSLISPYLLQLKEYADESDLPDISDKVRKHYLGDKKISSETLNEIIRIISDRLYMNSIEHSVRLHAAASRAPVYMYIFGYKGKQSFSKYLRRSKSNVGVCHIDDLIYLLKMGRFDPHKDLDVHNIMVKTWISFIKSGIPDTGTGVQWPPVSSGITYIGNIDYLLIDDKIPKSMSRSEISERIFWDSLPLKELHISGDLHVPKYFQDQQKNNWFPSIDELKIQVIIARIQRMKVFANILKKRIKRSSKKKTGK